MSTALEKARKDPNSMKAKILSSALNLFAEYGYHGVTTRMIAKDVGIDISTLHYHWGDKENLYEAVITDMNEKMGQRLKDIEKIVSGKSISYRLDVAIDVMCDFLFDNPAFSKLIMFTHFMKTRAESNISDNRMTRQVSNIAYAMGLVSDKKGISPQANARVLAVSNAIYSFTSGEAFYRPILDVKRKEYIEVVKDTLKFILIPAFSKE